MAALTASALKLVFDRTRVNVHAPSPPPDATTCCRSVTGAPRYSFTSGPVPLAGSNRVDPAGVPRAAGTSTLSTHWASFGNRFVTSRARPGPPPPPAGAATCCVSPPPPAPSLAPDESGPVLPLATAGVPVPLVPPPEDDESSPPNRPPK